jgi:hypothetical protein
MDSPDNNISLKSLNLNLKLDAQVFFHHSRESAWASNMPMECESSAFATDAKAKLLHSLLQFDVGLLRMTVFNTRSAT